MPSSLRHAAAPYLWILLGLLAVFMGIATFAPVRVGDGTEYYGLYYAWQAGGRPWMTAAAYHAYDALFSSQKILGLVGTDALAHAFPALRVGDTGDFNHFWLYSLFAFLCGKLVALFGLHLGVHACFLAVHFAAMAGTCALAYRCYAWRGLLAVLLMLLASPMLWFIDKVHTEFLTVCLMLSAVILVMSGRYLAAALMCALAAPQNPSFALIACLPVLFRLLQVERKYRLTDVAMLVVIVLAILLHPAYYFARYGVVTPQLLAGGAALGGHLSTFYIWIIDPDLGLLPNWPLGLAAVLGAIVLRVGLRKAAGAPWDGWALAFCAWYLLVNFYAHSSTTNLNSGATPGLARYALWYLPLAFPLLLMILRQFPARPAVNYAAAIATGVLVVLSVKTNDPRRPERYTTPSLSSAFLQTHAPHAYNAPPEVFMERYSGMGEQFYSHTLRAVVGPDCRKILLVPNAALHDAAAPGACGFDKNKLNAYINSLPANLPAGPLPTDPFTVAAYVWLPDAIAAQLAVQVAAGAHATTDSGDGNVILGQGWSGPEGWGVWSQERHATLVLPCNANAQLQAASRWELGLKLRPFGKQRIIISGPSGILWQGPINQVDQDIRIAVSRQDCRQGQYQFDLAIPDAMSPKQMGLSGDERMLGVGLASFEIRLP